MLCCFGNFVSKIFVCSKKMYPKVNCLKLLVIGDICESMQMCFISRYETKGEMLWHTRKRGPPDPDCSSRTWTLDLKTGFQTQDLQTRFWTLKKLMPTLHQKSTWYTETEQQFQLTDYLKIFDLLFGLQVFF